jgi:hypothetical protein
MTLLNFTKLTESHFMSEPWLSVQKKFQADNLLIAHHIFGEIISRQLNLPLFLARNQFIQLIHYTLQNPHQK